MSNLSVTLNQIRLPDFLAISVVDLTSRLSDSGRRALERVVAPQTVDTLRVRIHKPSG